MLRLPGTGHEVCSQALTHCRTGCGFFPQPLVSQASSLRNAGQSRLVGGEVRHRASEVRRLSVAPVISEQLQFYSSVSVDTFCVERGKTQFVHFDSPLTV